MSDLEPIFQAGVLAAALTAVSSLLAWLLAQTRDLNLRYRLTMAWIASALLAPPALFCLAYFRLSPPGSAMAASLFAAAAPEAGQTASSVGFHAAAAALALWTAGAFFQTARLAVSAARFRRRLHSARPLSGWALALFQKCCRLIPPRLKVEARSAQVPVPFVCGTLSPLLVLPSPRVSRQDPACALMICHELAHVRRFDTVAKLGAALVRALYFFNPLAHKLCRILEHDCELLCDEEVLKHRFDPKEYADLLCALAEESLPGHRFASCLSGPEPFLKIRIARILERRTPMKSNRLAASLFWVFLVVITAGTLAAGGAATYLSGSQAAQASSEEVKPKLIKKVSPVYPEAAKQEGIEGTVLLEVRIDEKGKTVEVKAVEGHELLLRAAKEAVSQWEYKPALKDGKPGPVSATVSVVFSLSRQPKAPAAPPPAPRAPAAPAAPPVPPSPPRPPAPQP